MITALNEQRQHEPHHHPVWFPLHRRGSGQKHCSVTSLACLTNSCSLVVLMCRKGKTGGHGSRRPVFGGVKQHSMIPGYVQGGTRVVPGWRSGASGPSQYCECLFCAGVWGGREEVAGAAQGTQRHGGDGAPAWAGNDDGLEMDCPGRLRTACSGGRAFARALFLQMFGLARTLALPGSGF